MPKNYLSVTYNVDVWVLNSSEGNVLATHGELGALLTCAYYFAKESNASLRIFNRNGVIDSVYTYEEYTKILS